MPCSILTVLKITANLKQLLTHENHRSRLPTRVGEAVIKESPIIKTITTSKDWGRKNSPRPPSEWVCNVHKTNNCKDDGRLPWHDSPCFIHGETALHVGNVTMQELKPATLELLWISLDPYLPDSRQYAWLGCHNGEVKKPWERPCIILTVCLIPSPTFVKTAWGD